jgi:hypothetical protein
MEIVDLDGIGVSADLVWTADRTFAAWTRCNAELVDDSGRVVWQGGSGIVEAQQGGTRPIRTNVMISTHQPIDDQDVGKVSCKS